MFVGPDVERTNWVILNPFTFLQSLHPSIVQPTPSSPTRAISGCKIWVFDTCSTLTVHMISVRTTLHSKDCARLSTLSTAFK